MDFLSRRILESGELQHRIEHQALRGITSNPAIFEKSMTSDESYQADIQKGIQQNLSPRRCCINRMSWLQ